MCTSEEPNQCFNHLDLDEQFIKCNIYSFSIYKKEFIEDDCKVLDFIKYSQPNALMQTMFCINNDLKIHSLAFHQLSDQEKCSLLLCTCNIDQEERIKRKLVSTPIRRKYKIAFKSDINFHLMCIVKELIGLQLKPSVTYTHSIDDIVLMIISGKPHETERVFVLFNKTLPKNTTFKRAAVAFALFENVNNIADFCAVIEFASITMNSDVSNHRQKWIEKGIIYKEAIKANETAMQAGLEALSEEVKCLGLTNENIKKHKDMEKIHQIKMENLQEKAKELNVKRLKAFDKAKDTKQNILEVIASKLIEREEQKKNYSARLEKYIKECIVDEGIKFSSPWTEVTHFLKHCDKNFQSLGLENSADFTLFLRQQMFTQPTTRWTQAGTHKFHYHKFLLNNVVYTLQIVEEVSTTKKTIVTVYLDQASPFD